MRGAQAEQARAARLGGQVCGVSTAVLRSEPIKRTDAPLRGVSKATFTPNSAPPPRVSGA